jgi:proline iminopeptidase
MSPQSFTATTPEGPIAGSVQGEGAPLLALHGGPGLSDYMELLADEFDGWRWASYYQRGLSPSAEQGPFTVERHVEDAVAVLDSLQVDKAVVLGHSWGGHLALHVAIAHPERVAGLVLVDPLGAVGDGGLGDHARHMEERLSPDSRQRYAEVAERLQQPDASDADALASLALLWPSYFADPPNAPAMPSTMRMSLVAYASTFASVGALLAAGLTDKVSQITVPVVLVLGEKSPMPVSQGQQTAALLSRSEVHIVPGAGHLPWHEQPGCVATALARIAQTLSMS